MDYQDALLYMQGRLRLGTKLGHERFLALLARLGSPHEALRVVHIAGTKGKGSTTAMAASILQAAGYSVGLYLSPFVYDVRERVQINGVPIPKADFARLVSQIRPHIEALEATDLGPTTEFELKTAVGLCLFAERQVDYAVLEVGIGGRLDATNVIARPLVSVITNIGLDHTEILGKTLAEIAREKAGIVKPGIPCVTAVPEDSEAFAVIAGRCRDLGAPLQTVRPEGPGAPGVTRYWAEPDTPAGGGTLTVQTPRRRLSGLSLRLRGAFQHVNAATAVAALDAVPPDQLPPLPDAAVRQGLESAYLPGRLERIAYGPTVVVDVAHNELSGQALAEALRDEFGALRRRLILVVGLSRNHAPDTFLGPLAALKPALLVATEPSFRPRDAAEVAAAARQWGVPRVEVRAESAVAAARTALAHAEPEDLICVTGSFVTVGDLPPAVWSDLLAQKKGK